MKLRAGIIQHWLEPGVFAVWSIFLSYLLLSQRYVSFLRPGFYLLLSIALFISIGLIFTAMVRGKTTSNDLSHIFRVMVLLTPVMYALTIPDEKLGNMAFQKRYIGPINLRADYSSQSTFHPQESESHPSPLSQHGSQDSSQQYSPLERSILQIFVSPNLYKGKRIIVQGMIVREDKLKQHFGGINSAVYRFLINCCAADAVPLAIALSSDQIESFTNDQWVEVDGIFDLQQINGKPVPFLLNPLIKTIEEPAMPYLF